MKARLLLASAALVAGVSGANAEVSAFGGAAIFSLPPMPGLAYAIVTTAPGSGQSIETSAYGIVPVYGFAMTVPAPARIGAFGSGFHAAASSSFTADVSGGTDGTGLALFSIYRGNGDVFAGGTVGGTSASAQANVQTLDPNAYTFVVAATAEATDFGVCHGDDIVDDCSQSVNAFDFAPGGTGLGYATILGEAGVLIAAAGVFPEGALTLTESSGFRYFGGQAGTTIALDLGNAQATAQVGGIFRSLGQFHQTAINLDIDLPVEGGTLSVEHSTVTDETLLARYFGAFFGVSIENNATSRLVASLDIGVAPMVMQTRYTGLQSSTLDVQSPETDVFATTDLPTVDLGEIRGALLVNLGGEIGFRIGNAAKITFGGFAEYLSAAPQLLRNYVDGRPTSTVPVTGLLDEEDAYATVQGVTGNPVAIGYQPMFTYGALVRLTIGLGGP